MHMGSTIAILTAVLLTAPAVEAQLVTGSLLGSVKDPSSLAVAGATITVTMNATGRVRTASTGDTGDFVVTGLDGGVYTLRVTMQGFKQLEKTNIPLTAGDRLSLGVLTLELGAVTETVSVTAQGAIVQTRSAERSETVTDTQLQNLLVRGRNVMDLMQLLPGVVSRSQPENLSLSANFSVLGNRQTTNNITVDGIPATDMGNGTQLKLTVSQDAVAEVKILVSNYQAEYGRMAGSNVILVTKSGTRDFHGLASYFKRHEQFNANDFFRNRNGLPKPRYRYNTFTYNLGGPVFLPGKFNRNRDKLFFNWGQEFWPIRDARSGSITVPTELERTGNYSQTVDLNARQVPIRDPISGQPFAGNLIPASRLDPNGLALLKMFPMPNFFDRGISRGQFNYVFNTPLDSPKYTHSLKADYNATSRDAFTFGFNKFSDESSGSVGTTASGGINWPMYQKTYTTTPFGLTGRYTKVFSPSLINEFNFGYLDQPADDVIAAEQLKLVQRASIGFNAGQFSRTGNPLDVIPNATFGGVPTPANIAIEGRFPLFNRYYIYSWSNNLSWTRGSHTFKAGLYIEQFRRNQKKAVPFNGSFDFGRNVNNPLDSNWAYSNAILGVYNTYTESTDAAWMNVRALSPEFFVQDNWKVTRRLTLDYGMRFYIVPPLYERDDLIAGFVPSAYDAARRARLIQPGFNANRQRVGVHPVTGQIFPAAQIGAIAPGVGDPANGMVVDARDSTVPRGFMRNRGINFGPRFGIAYDVFGDGKMAIRAGGGIFYNRFFSETFFNPFVGQPPIIDTPVVNFGRLPELRNATGLLYPANVFAADPAGYLPTVYNFSLSIQRDVGWGTVVDLGYAGSLGRHLYWRRDINPIPLGANFNPANFDPTIANRPLPAPFLRPIQGYNNINMIEGAGSSNYHGLLFSAKRRFTRGLEFGAAYTWSKALDYNDTDTEAISPLVNVRVWNYGRAGFDRTHIFNLNYIWELPVRKMNHPAAAAVLNGWQVSGITSFVSGEPLGIGQSFVNAIDITGTPSQGARVVALRNPVLPKSERTFSRNFRTDVFGASPVGTIGNAAKNLIRGPGINNWDMALFKTFPIREPMRLQFRWELYNAFNHTQFGGLDTGARWDAQGNQVNQRFGEFTSARGPRQMQFALRFFF
jgi:hypothetical protein